MKTKNSSHDDRRKEPLKVLCISDETDPALARYLDVHLLNTYDLIISCGDLPSSYLSRLADFFHGPLFCVPGNHDGKDAWPPKGCISIDGKIIEYKGWRILGLGGSVKYNSDVHQYTQKQMTRRIQKLYFPLKKAGGIDILVTHAPAKGTGDLSDPAHAGFEAFVNLKNKYRPKYHIYGHVHLTYCDHPRIISRDGCTAVNAYQKTVLDLKPDIKPDHKPVQKPEKP